MISVNPSTHEVLEDWEAEGVADQMLSDIYGTVTIAGYTMDGIDATSGYEHHPAIKAPVAV